MPPPYPLITSPQNPKIKSVVKLRRKPHRDDHRLMIIEGYRELHRALDHGHLPGSLFVCPEMFLGENEEALISSAMEAGAEVFECTAPVFAKMAYRDRPEGLLALAPAVGCALADLNLAECPLILVAASIEKPGNLGTMLRSADASGTDAVIVCDECTDINNPNVVRASIGTIFSIPVAEASSAETIKWLQLNGIKIVSASPHSETHYFSVDMRRPTAIVVGAEQYGLPETWMAAADDPVVIPMLGDCDSLNVASAATILLYEAVRQRKA